MKRRSVGKKIPTKQRRASAPRAAKQRAPAAVVVAGTVPTSLQDDLRHLKRERILAEAARLFAERGYVGTTLDDVAARLGITKPFIYAQFASKSQLLEASFNRIVDACLQAAEDALASPRPAAERLQQLVRAIVAIAAENSTYARIFLREEKSLDPAMLAAIRAREDRWHAGLQRLLAQGVQSGEFRIPDVRLAALVIGGQIAWLYSGRDTAAEFDPEVVADGVVDLVMRMVGARQ
jgi:AcrR family transcriptional regulator